MCETVGIKTFIGMTKERQSGKTWEQIAKRYVIGSPEEARRVYERTRWALQEEKERL